MKHLLLAPIVERERLATDLVRLTLEAPAIAADFQPGQFVNVKVADEDYPLLRRPLSIQDSDGRSWISLVFRIVGLGTKLLAGQPVGEPLDVIGPLGEPFRIDAARHALLIGGGVGIPPINALQRELARRQISHTALLGLRTADESGLAGALPEQAEECLISTDDGTLGHHGFVTDLLAERLSADVAVYACGPGPLLRKIIALCKEVGAPAQVSFEQQMACGVGACIGCSIETNRGYQRVCSEGPVFDAALF
ncbi:dihydroorotate dehydrogenase electron transfer subunit, partial [Candidatus Sumerlaeota bacterium]